MPAPEVWRARGLSRGATAPPPEPSAGLGQIPNRGQVSNPPSYSGAPQPFAPSPEILQTQEHYAKAVQLHLAEPCTRSAWADWISEARHYSPPPSTLQNPAPESIYNDCQAPHKRDGLREVLSHLDNASLLKIAKKVAG